VFALIPGYVDRYFDNPGMRDQLHSVPDSTCIEIFSSDFGLWQSQKTSEADIIKSYQELGPTGASRYAEHLQLILTIHSLTPIGCIILSRGQSERSSEQTAEINSRSAIQELASRHKGPLGLLRLLSLPSMEELCYEKPILFRK
jgi:hypothetical protein